MNKNVVATIRHNEYKDVLYNNKCLRHPVNIIQVKDHRIGVKKVMSQYLMSKVSCHHVISLCTYFSFLSLFVLIFSVYFLFFEEETRC